MESPLGVGVKFRDFLPAFVESFISKLKIGKSPLGVGVKFPDF